MTVLFIATPQQCRRRHLFFQRHEHSKAGLWSPWLAGDRWCRLPARGGRTPLPSPGGQGEGVPEAGAEEGAEEGAEGGAGAEAGEGEAQAGAAAGGCLCCVLGVFC